MIKYNAIDNNNIPRVYGIGKNDYEAKRQCELALDEYIKWCVLSGVYGVYANVNYNNNLYIFNYFQ